VPTFRAAIALLMLLIGAGDEASAGKKKAAQPVEIRAMDVAFHDGRVFVGGTAGLTVYRIDEHGAPKAVARVGLPGTVRGLTIEGDRAYLAVGAQGLFVLEIADPEQMAVLARYDPPGPVERVVVRDGVAYLAEDRDGLAVVDLTDPTKPRRLARVSTRGQMRALALEGDRLATAEGSGAARLFDVSVPARPRRLAEFRGADGARDVAWREGKLLVATGRGGLQCFDPDAPRTPIGQVAALTSAWAVALHGDLALVASGGAGVQIVDLSDPLHARQVASFALPDRSAVRRISADGDRLFLAADVGGLAVAGIAEPSRPQLLHPRERKMRVRIR
jgi:hypothetical protein